MELGTLNGRLVFITEPMEDNDLPFALFLDEDVNEVAPGNQTALHLSALFHEYDLMMQLICLPGIDVNARDSSGQTPLINACRSIFSEGNRCVRLLLTCNDIDVNAQRYYKEKAEDAHEDMTALMLAAYTGKVSVVQSLLSHPDIDIRIKNRRGETALEVAKRSQSENGVDMTSTIEALRDYVRKKRLRECPVRKKSPVSIQDSLDSSKD